MTIQDYLATIRSCTPRAPRGHVEDRAVETTHRLADALEIAVSALRQVEANTRMKGRFAVNAYVQDALARIDRLLDGEEKST